MISGFEKLISKDSITLTDVYDLVDDIIDKVCVMIQITLVIGFALGAICMAIVDKIVG
jgi:hypothetical protein